MVDSETKKDAMVNNEVAIVALFRVTDGIHFWPIDWTTL